MVCGPTESRRYTPETPWSPLECWRVPWSTQPRNVPELGRSRFCWGMNRLRNCAKGALIAASPAVGQNTPYSRSPIPTLLRPELLCKHCRGSPRVRTSFQGTKVICLGLLPTHDVSLVYMKVKACLLQF